jgi:hypothetical protein
MRASQYSIVKTVMAKRDPRKTARRKRVAAMKTRLRKLLPAVLSETGFAGEQSLNSTIGHKTDFVIDLKHEVILSPDHYVALWMEGFKKQLSAGGGGFGDLFETIKASPALKKYLKLFLQRSYLKHYEELYKKRPEAAEAEIWIGENHADYGLLVAPRFANGDWENDESEIRHFAPLYWTIGHVLETGLAVPGKDQIMDFPKVDHYLKFFENVLVRGTASSHQKKIAAMYSDFVRASDRPLDIPLLIPEFRYNGRAAKHEHRLDFCVIDPHTLDKVGFELSPWSSHGKLTIKGKTAAAINDEAKANAEKDARKVRKYFRKHGVFVLTYTDADLAKPDALFADIRNHLEVTEPTKQLSFGLIDDYFQ